ncbi:MAG: hypothetical protein WD941_06930, partial [Opitutus sp.]
MEVTEQGHGRFKDQGFQVSSSKFQVPGFDPLDPTIKIFGDAAPSPRLPGLGVKLHSLTETIQWNVGPPPFDKLKASMG